MKKTTAVKYFSVLACVLMCAGLAGAARADDQSAQPDPAVPTETVLIRDGDTVIYQGTVSLPDSGTVDITDDTGTSHAVSSDSILGLAYSIGQSSGAFSLSDVHYYDSFGSLYLKCMTPSGGTAACDDWQYSVNGQTPSSGMDATLLSGGESVGIYFGTPHRVTLDVTTFTAGGTVTAVAQTYNYIDNTWSPLAGVTIGATVPNPADAYNPTVVVSKAVGVDGSAALVLSDAGTYTVGISEDYYFPSYTVTVTPQETVVSQIMNTGSGGSTTVDAPRAKPAPIPVQAPAPVAPFSVQKALAYLAGAQATDGSFYENGMYTDWAAMALSVNASTDDVRIRLLTYLSTHLKVEPVLTDNERHAMALLAIGQDPYAFQGSDYIQSIVAAFDGTQFGDPHLVNDDLFALIPLASSGYSASDSIIAKDVAFVLSQQQPDGSWNESTDMTAAAVQALSLFGSVPGASAGLAKAGMYLQGAQGSDGGFGSVYSTAWATQAMSTLGASWTKNGHSISDYFSAHQADDGAVLPLSESQENRAWSTSYAIPAMLGKSWNTLFHAVSRPSLPVSDASPAVQAVQPVIPAEVPLAAVKGVQQKTDAAQQVAQASVPETGTVALSAATVKSGMAIPFDVVAGGVAALGVLWLFSRYFVIRRR